MPHQHITVETLIHCVRLFLRDTFKNNELLSREETTDLEIKFAINTAIGRWNSTLPLITPVGIEDFPSSSWLIRACACGVLESLGILHYRNELPFNDNGISVNPWSKGPNYTNLAGTLSQNLMNEAHEIKYAINTGNTFGVVRSAEFRRWDYAGLFNNGLFGSDPTASASPTSLEAPTPGPASQTPTKTAPLLFGVDSWVPNPAAQEYVFAFQHNLGADVDVRITDPASGEDRRNKCSRIRFSNKNLTELFVAMTPDGRFEGQIIAYKI